MSECADNPCPQNTYCDLSNTPQTCKPCDKQPEACECGAIANCQRCPTTKCDSCLNDKRGDDCSCSFGATNCATCTADGDICASCANGFFTPVRGVFRAGLSVTCQTCTGSQEEVCVCGGGIAGNCGTCAEGGLACNTCAQGFYQEGPGEVVCLECDLTCKSCVGLGETDCTSCKIGFYLETDGSCKRCSKACLSCNGPASTDCTVCNTGYHEESARLSNCVIDCTPSNCPDANKFCEDKICKTCGNGCLECSSSSVCSKCENGKYQTSGNSCSICEEESMENFCFCAGDNSQNCKTCVDSVNENKCNSCLKNYILKDGFCEPPRCSDSSCGAGKFCDTVSNQCQLCGTGLNCKTCLNDTACDVCADYFISSGNSPNVICTDCIVGYSGDNCDKCADKYFEKTPIPLLCEQCSKACSLCQGEADQCTQCAPGYEPQTAVSGDNPGICVLILACNITNCVTCADSTTCKVCSNNHNLTANSTVCEECKIDQTTQCTCGDILDCVFCPAELICYKCVAGYYKTPLKCKKCMDNCATCSKGDSCDTCNTDFSGSDCSCKSTSEAQNCDTCISGGEVCSTCKGNFAPVDIKSQGVTCDTCKPGFTGDKCETVVEEDKRGLSGGAIAGIVIGVIVVISSVAGGVYYHMKKVKGGKTTTIASAAMQ